MERHDLPHERGGYTTRVAAEERIRFLEGRPRRDEPIDSDDITNLKIALNTAQSMQEFLGGV